MTQTDDEYGEREGQKGETERGVKRGKCRETERRDNMREIKDRYRENERDRQGGEIKR